MSEREKRDFWGGASFVFDKTVKMLQAIRPATALIRCHQECICERTAQKGE